MQIIAHFNLARVLPLPSSQDIRLNMPIQMTPDE